MSKCVLYLFEELSELLKLNLDHFILQDINEISSQLIIPVRSEVLLICMQKKLSSVFIVAPYTLRARDQVGSFRIIGKVDDKGISKLR